MLRVIIDTDLLSEILRAVDSRVVEAERAHGKQFGKLTFASVTRFEILFGLGHKDATAQIARAEALFDRNEEIVPESEDYRLAAEIASALSRRGRLIGMVDPIIAACAIRRGLGVASGNTRHFEYIRKAGYQFHLENWRDELP